ncbi:hypothetical protein [Sphingomonas adhaesiva]|uniref:hypothetical protein n=1 Tax=Sphingomonas adhaesiva TaxID=28212 RepID=UPI002FF77DA5
MRRWTIGAAASVMVVGAAILAGAAGAQAPAPQSISLQNTGQGWQPVVFVCDSTNRDRVLTLSAPARDRTATLTAFAKPGLATRTMEVRVGASEAGMSQIWYPLTDANGRTLGNVHAVNPGVVEPGATTPTVTSIALGDDTSSCRFAPQTRVLGVTPKRSIQITRTENRGYRYRSYNYDSNLPEVSQPWGGRDTRASLTIDNGRLFAQRGGTRVYQFENGGYVYRVLASTDATQAGGGVQVWHAGKLVLAERFGAYTAAVQP